jgi:hypothetical protein
MSYRINKTDGTEITQIPDGKLDSSTSLTLLGKNVKQFGESLNENFVHLLENFASQSTPQRPIRGQLWYDTASGRLKVYDGNGFKVTGGPIVSPIRPPNLVAGDLWLNNEENQMYFFDGTTLTLAGPSYSRNQGVSGLVTNTLLDRTTGQSRTVSALYVGGTLLGIFSSTDLIPSIQLPGYGPVNRPIFKGFNVAATIDLKFDVTSSRAENLVLGSGVVKTADEVVYKNTENIFTEPISLLTNEGMKVGVTNQFQLLVVSDNVVLENTAPDRDININVKSGLISNNAVTIKGETSRIGLWNSAPQFSLDLNGSMRISGDLVIGGDSLTINTTNITTKDKSIELNVPDDGSLVTDASANLGGIILKGSTDKTILYNNDTASWDLSENLNLLAGKKLRIDDVTVLEEVPTAPGEYQLGANVTTAPGLTKIGSLTDLNAGQVQVTTNRISTPPNTDMEFNLPGGGNLVLVAGGQIKGVDNPTDIQDAANKIYVDNLTFSKPLSMSLDITGLTLYTGDDDNDAIAEILDVIAPFYDIVNPTNTPDGVATTGTKVFLHTTRRQIENSIYSIPLQSYNYEYESVISADGSSIVPVLRNFVFSPFPTSTPTITTFRQNKLFVMGGGQNPQIGRWGFVQDLGPEYTTVA